MKIPEERYLKSGIVLIFGVIFLLMVSGAAVAADDIECANVAFDGGDGTPEDPYQISTAAQLQCVDDDRDAHYELVDDVDLSSIDNFEPIGDQFSDGPFTGSFDGNGHEIHGLTIDQSDEMDVALFRWTAEGAVIENVAIVGADISGSYRTGILVGLHNDRSGTPAINNVTVSGTVEGLDRKTGGVIGRMSGGTAYNVSADVEVTGDWEVGGIAGDIVNDGEVENVHVTGSVSGDDEVGGIGGEVGYRSIVSNSYSEANVSGVRDVGGLVGILGDGIDPTEGTIETSYAVGTIDGTFRVGGLAGTQTEEGTIADSYWDVEATGQDSSEEGTGLETAEMIGEAAAENMEGFDFDETWTIVEDEYPQLRSLVDETDEDDEDGPDDGDDEEETGEVTIALDPADVDVEPGETVTFELVVEEAIEGVGAYEMDLYSDDPTVTFVNVSLRDDPDFPITQISDDGTHLSMEVGMGGNQHAPADEIVIAELTIAVADETAPGESATIDVEDAQVADVDVDQYEIRAQKSATLSIVDLVGVFEIESVDDRELSVQELAAVSFDVPVTNVGNGNDTQPVTLQIDGETVATTNASIGAGETTNVTFDEISIDRDPGEYTYTVVTEGDEQSGTLTIVGGPDPIVGDAPPQDLTGDGLYEDIDGDGEFTIFDVQMLFNNLDTDSVQEYPEAFNFAGDDDPDEVTIFDVQALFGQLQE